MRSADGWDPLFTAGALPVEVFGVYSGERELVLEGLAPAPVRLSQRLAGVSSCCADRSSRADGSSGGCESSVLLWESAVVLAEVWASGTSSLPSRHAAHVIELGAGLGLTSICCAAHGASDVLATEIEPALCALRGSIEMNRACWALDTGAHNTGALDTGALGVGARDTDHNARLRAARLDWTETPTQSHSISGICGVPGLNWQVKDRGCVCTQGQELQFSMDDCSRRERESAALAACGYGSTDRVLGEQESDQGCAGTERNRQPTAAPLRLHCVLPTLTRTTTLPRGCAPTTGEAQ